MPQEVLNIILSAVSIAVTGLASWAVGLLISWMNKKIKDQTLAKHLTAITQIVTDAVMNVFQSFVETLKNNGKFDEAAQKEAKDRALDIIMKQLTPELKDYITTNFGDLTEWLSNKIESVIYGLKATNKIAVKSN
jgi:hypothetical protein